MRESQRSIHKLNECVLQPLTEFQRSRAAGQVLLRCSIFQQPLIVIDEPEITMSAAERFRTRLPDMEAFFEWD